MTGMFCRFHSVGSCVTPNPAPPTVTQHTICIICTCICITFATQAVSPFKQWSLTFADRPACTMPVSLDRLIAEREAGVVTDELIRDCIVVCALICCCCCQGFPAISYSRAPVLSLGCLQVTTPCPESADDNKRELAFEQVEVAAFSFRGLASISNLWGLDKLVKLQLDNNRIQRIENLGHLVRFSHAVQLHAAASTRRGTHDILQIAPAASSGLTCSHCCCPAVITDQPHMAGPFIQPYHNHRGPGAADAAVRPLALQQPNLKPAGPGHPAEPQRAVNRSAAGLQHHAR